MRLTILSRDAPPVTGGIADHTAHLARALAARGHEVSLVTGVPADAIDGVHVLASEGFDRIAAGAIATEVASTLPEAVLWAYNPFSYGSRGLARRAIPLARALRSELPYARLVLFAHELWYPPGRGAIGMVWRSAQRRAGRGVLRIVDAAIVTTDERAEELDALGHHATMIPVGSNLPDLPADPAARTRLPIPLDAFVVTHLGGVGPGRDLATGLDGFTRFRVGRADACLVLAGDTGPLPRLPAGVTATGRRTGADLAVLLRASDIYLHLDPVGPTPGRRTTLVAALQAGLPVLAFDGEQTEAWFRGNARLVKPGDPEALAAAMRELASDPDMRARLGQASRERYEADFTWTRISERVEAVCTGECRPTRP